MQETTPENLSPAEYNERLIRPGANISFFAWFALLGIPFLLLFLIYSETEARLQPKVPTHAVEHHRPIHR